MKACTQCGRCCLLYGAGARLGPASDKDMDRWHGQPGCRHVLDWVDLRLGDLWFSPRTGEETNRCPWLRKVPRRSRYTCRIYHCRPDACRGYPVSLSQAYEDRCEMLELEDLAQVARALDVTAGTYDPFGFSEGFSENQ